jgi:hypothetical protein
MGDQKDERPAPPDRFVVTTEAGLRLTGGAARIEIKYRDAVNEPEVEIFFSASSDSEDAWEAYAAAPAEFLETLELRAPVVDRPLQSGEASVSVNLKGASLFGASGLLALRVQAGLLMGEASGMSAQLSATLEGPFALTCAVPAAAMTAGAAAPASENRPQILVVDEQFESALCARYRPLADQSR